MGSVCWSCVDTLAYSPTLKVFSIRSPSIYPWPRTLSKPGSKNHLPVRFYTAPHSMAENVSFWSSVSGVWAGRYLWDNGRGDAVGGRYALGSSCSPTRDLRTTGLPVTVVGISRVRKSSA